MDNPHLIDGAFQSDKYPTCPRGEVPLSTKDPMAQDLLAEYARRRRAVDVAFSDALETALHNHGYLPAPMDEAMEAARRIIAKLDDPNTVRAAVYQPPDDEEIVARALLSREPPAERGTLDDMQKRIDGLEAMLCDAQREASQSDPRVAALRAARSLINRARDTYIDSGSMLDNDMGAWLAALSLPPEPTGDGEC